MCKLLRAVLWMNEILNTWRKQKALVLSLGILITQSTENRQKGAENKKSEEMKKIHHATISAYEYKRRDPGSRKFS